MNYKILKYFICSILLSMSINTNAQSNGDKLFMEGQNLQKTMTVASQNAAIKKFQAAKVVYTTSDKKKMCDNQISICKSNISSLRGGRNKGNKNNEKEEKPAVTLSLSQKEVVFDGAKGGTFNIVVTAPTMDWNFNIPDGVGGLDNFAKVTRSSDAKSINIEVGENPTTLDRMQIVNVTNATSTEVLSILQTGKPVTLSTSSNEIEFGLKGGKKTIELYTNSDSIITSNNDLTWYIESRPDWLETNVEVKKDKSVFGKGLSALKGLVSGSASASQEADVKISNIKITVQPIPKSSPLYQKGRKGEIVFASQDKRYKINIVQQK